MTDLLVLMALVTSSSEEGRPFFLFHSGRFNQELYDFTFSSERYDFDVNTAALNRSVVQSRPMVQCPSLLGGLGVVW
jgi:hypothetical protein